jgi:hypothetical protein
MTVPRLQFVVPPAVDERLEELLHLAYDEGNRLSRSEIVAALIWHCPLDGDGLGVIVREYRRAMRSVSQPARGGRRPGPRPFASTVTNVLHG